jgi:hypothetical protein
VTVRLALLEHWVPTRLKLTLLDELALVTAEGFDCPPPKWSGPRFERRLTDYTRFTATCAAELLATHDDALTHAARTRLRGGATRLGAKLRDRLGLRGSDDALGALALLYRHLGIETEARATGELVVTSCLFSASFSEQVCCLVAGLDEGMAAGLSGGGRLEFVERITAGDTCCRARFEPAPRS